MGYIREKIINGESKYYWIASKRDGKKSGGTGKVKKIERYLGDRRYLFWERVGETGDRFCSVGFYYLSWYVWNGDIKPEDFINKLVVFQIKSMYGCDQLDFTLTKQNKVIFIKKKNATIDLRERYYKNRKDFINQEIEDNLKTINLISGMIDRIIYYLQNFNENIKGAKQVDKKIDIDTYIQWENRANSWFNWANQDLEKILNYVPRTQREEAKKKIWGYCLQRCPLEKLDL